jgi:hypothetical protein
MDGTCGMNGGKKEMNTGFCWGNLWEKSNLEDLRVYGSVILKRSFKKQNRGIDSIDLAQAGDINSSIT